MTEGPYWVEVDTENYLVLAARSTPVDDRIEYLATKLSGTPRWVSQDDVDQVLFP